MTPKALAAVPSVPFPLPLEAQGHGQLGDLNRLDRFTWGSMTLGQDVSEPGRWRPETSGISWSYRGEVEHLCLFLGSLEGVVLHRAVGPHDY